MKLDQANLDRFIVPPVRIAAFPRIIAARHTATPTGAGYGSSRFSSPSKAFRILYAAASFGTAFAEAVVRDHFEGRLKRLIYQTTLEGYAVTQIASTRPLRILDLTGDHSYRLGINTDAVRGRVHQPGQAFAESLFAQTDIDAIFYASRLIGELCIAIFDRALPDIIGSPARPLLTVADLAPELARLKVKVCRRRKLSSAV